jgi:hypothetical protein
VQVAVAVVLQRLVQMQHLQVLKQLLEMVAQVQQQVLMAQQQLLQVAEAEVWLLVHQLQTQQV